MSDLEDAKEWVLENRREGVQCPCCTQFVKEYRWSLYGTAVKLLIALYKRGGTETFIDSQTVKGEGQGDGSRLRYFRLAEHEKDRRPDGGKSSYWRVTPRGEAFLKGKPCIYKYVWVFNGTVLRYEGEPVDVYAVVNKKFNFDEMMGGLF